MGVSFRLIVVIIGKLRSREESLCRKCHKYGHRETILTLISSSVPPPCWNSRKVSLDKLYFKGRNYVKIDSGNLSPSFALLVLIDDVVSPSTVVPRGESNWSV